MKISASFVVRFCFVLLLGAAAFGLLSNVLGGIGRPLLGKPTPVPETGKTLRFVIVAPQYDHPYWALVRHGASAMGQTINVHVDFTAPWRASVEEQARLLDTATSAQVDGIITQGVHDPRVAAAIAKAVNRGIPVITVDTDSPGPRLAYVGSDNYQAGQLAARDLIQRMHGEKAVVGIIRGDFGPEDQDERVKGFKDTVAGVAGIQIVAVESSDLTRTAAGQQALKIRQEHPDVNVFYGTTALDAVGVVQSVSSEGMLDRVTVIGWDDVGEAADLVERGLIRSVIHQEPEAMGKRAVQLLEAYLRRDQRPKTTNYTPAVLREGVVKP
jgi:ribose transport system substrate-binding protein